MFKAYRLVYHSTLGSRVIKKKKTTPGVAHRPGFLAKEHSTHTSACQLGIYKTVRSPFWTRIIRQSGPHS